MLSSSNPVASSRVTAGMKELLLPNEDKNQRKQQLDKISATLTNSAKCVDTLDHRSPSRPPSIPLSMLQKVGLTNVENRKHT